jgi:hypothetical protein
MLTGSWRWIRAARGLLYVAAGGLVLALAWLLERIDDALGELWEEPYV